MQYVKITVAWLITPSFSAVVRERDELLALLDVQERMRFESLRSQSSDDDFYNFSSTEVTTIMQCPCMPFYVVWAYLKHSLVSTNIAQLVIIIFAFFCIGFSQNLERW